MEHMGFLIYAAVCAYMWYSGYMYAKETLGKGEQWKP